MAAGSNLAVKSTVFKNIAVVAVGVLLAGAIMHYGRNVAFIRDVIHDGFDS